MQQAAAALPSPLSPLKRALAAVRLRRSSTSARFAAMAAAAFPSPSSESATCLRRYVSRSLRLLNWCLLSSGCRRFSTSLDSAEASSSALTAAMRSASFASKSRRRASRRLRLLLRVASFLRGG